MSYKYIKIADTVHGELGHNGRSWVLNHPYCWDDRDHPAYYEETGIVTVSCGKGLDEDGCDPQVKFSEIYGVSRGGIEPRPEIFIPISVEQAKIADANRDAFDAIHKPPGGWVIITD